MSTFWKVYTCVSLFQSTFQQTASNLFSEICSLRSFARGIFLESKLQTWTWHLIQILKTMLSTPCLQCVKLTVGKTKTTLNNQLLFSAASSKLFSKPFNLSWRSLNASVLLNSMLSHRRVIWFELSPEHQVKNSAWYWQTFVIAFVLIENLDRASFLCDNPSRNASFCHEEALRDAMLQQPHSPFNLPPDLQLQVSYWTVSGQDDTVGHSLRHLRIRDLTPLPSGRLSSSLHSQIDHASQLSTSTSPNQEEQSVLFN